MQVIDTVITIGWGVFWIYWLVAAVGAKATRPDQGRLSGLGPGFRVAIVILVVVLLKQGTFRGHEVTLEPWLRGIGFALFMLGLALAVWARIYLAGNWGMPMTERTNPELVRTGPYRTVRHPIYSGILLALVGTSLAVGIYLLIAVFLLGAYFGYSAIVEERTMARLFPADYPDYKRSSARLVPFIF